MYKPLIFSLLTVVSACAHAPCVTTPPPKAEMLVCNQIETEAEGLFALVCTEESGMRFSNYLKASQQWEKTTWQACGPETPTTETKNEKETPKAKSQKSVSVTMH